MSPAVPGLEVVNPVYNLGNVPVNAMMNGAFELRNTGKAELIVRISKVSCSCTVSDISELRIAPGELASLPFQFKVDGKEGACGSTISLITNDPANHDFVLGIHGFATSIIGLSSRTLYFGTQEANSLPVTKNMRISSGKGSPEGFIAGITIIKPESYVKVSESRMEDNITLSVELLESVPLGLYKDSLKLQFDKYPGYEISIPIVAEIKGHYRARPSSMDFGLINQGETVEKKCRIEKQSPSDSIGVEKISTSLSAIFNTEVEETENDVIVVGRIQLDAQHPIVDGALYIKVSSDDGDYTIRIPVTAVARQNKS